MSSHCALSQPSPAAILAFPLVVLEGEIMANFFQGMSVLAQGVLGKKRGGVLLSHCAPAQARLFVDFAP